MTTGGEVAGLFVGLLAPLFWVFPLFMVTSVALWLLCPLLFTACHSPRVVWVVDVLCPLVLTAAVRLSWPVGWVGLAPASASAPWARTKLTAGAVKLVPCKVAL